MRNNKTLLSYYSLKRANAQEGQHIMQKQTTKTNKQTTQVTKLEDRVLKLITET